MISIHQQISRLKYSSTEFSSVFLKLKEDGSNLLNELEGPKGGEFDLNKFEGNPVYRVQHMLLNVGLVASELRLLTFWR